MRFSRTIGARGVGSSRNMSSSWAEALSKARGNLGVISTLGLGVAAAANLLVIGVEQAMGEKSKDTSEVERTNVSEGLRGVFCEIDCLM